MSEAEPAGGALVSLIAAQTEQDVYDTIVQVVHRLVPGSKVICSALMPSGEEFRMVSAAGLDSYLSRTVSLIGMDPTTISYKVADMRPEDFASYRSGRIELVPGGIQTLALGKIPKAASAAVERLLGISDVYAIGLAWEDFHYGGVVVGLPRGVRFENAPQVEDLVHQATIVIRRLRAERELRDRTEELDAFFSQSLDLLAIADMDGHFRRLNPKWEETLGFTVEELTATPFLDFVHPDDAAETAAAVARLAEGRPESHFVNRCSTKAGDYRWLEWRAFPRGDLIYAAARDLTERVEAERALRESEARYRLIADNTVDVIWMLDLDSHRFTYVSPSITRLRGYTVSEAMDQTMEDVLTPESLQVIADILPARLEAFARGDESARTRVDELDQPRKDGSIVHTEATTTLLTTDDGHADRILGVSRDISERRKAEAEIRALNQSLEARVRERTSQLEKAISELEAFSYSVSHDLRAPLRAINGYATILAEDHAEDIGPEGLRCCGNIIGNTRRMGQLIDDLLSFSRLGRTRLAREPVDMTALAQSAFSEIATEGQRGAVAFAVGTLAPVTGDPTLLRQVWANLISNALKFTAGRPEPEIRIESQALEGERVYVVADNGPGFDMRHSGKLFQVFERLHGAGYEGSGIGLAIVRRAVEAHGGRVWAESAPGEGARFFFSLPTAGPPQESPAP